MSLYSVKSNCEACRFSSVEVEIPSGPNPDIQPYRLCHACAKRLEALALRPIEWFNLAAVHGPGKYHLHDDFYDEDGKAYQARHRVEREAKFPIPTVGEIHGDLERLVDMAMTRWFFRYHGPPELVSSLAQQDRAALLSELQTRVREIPNTFIESRAYEIAEVVLRSSAAEWIRERSEAHSEESFTSWAGAAASCLPFDEGFQLVTARLATKPKKDPMLSLGALGSFRHSRTLDWMEENIHEPFTDVWGRLAALSQFSWPRAKAWIEAGRPLSLIALDALNACWRYDTVQLCKVCPKLLGATSLDEMADELRAYATRDSKPRAERAAKLAIEHLGAIIGSSAE